MLSAKLTSKGRITIPVALRQELGLQPGSRLVFIQSEDGSWRIAKRQQSILELAGALEWSGAAASIEDMDKAIRRRATDGHPPKPDRS